MAGSLRLQLFLCALVFMIGIGLIAAVQPVPPPTTAAAASAAVAPPPRPVRQPPPGGMDRPWGMAHPGAFAPSAGVLPPGARRWRGHDPRFGQRFERRAPADDFTIDGWRLLGALALTGGVGSLLWAGLSEARPARASGAASARLQRDMAALQGEIERLQREQRQLQMTVDWQERLLKHTAASAAGPGAALPEHADDV